MSTSPATRPGQSGEPGLRWLLFAIAMVLAAGAVPTGIAFVARPDGSLVGMPLTVLAPTPFADFRIPGLVLATVVGGSTLASAVLIAGRRRVAASVAFGAGFVVVGWIAAQVALIGHASALQPVVAALGGAMIALAARLQADGVER